MTDNEPEKGVIEILCKEIGFDYDERLETTDMLVSFVSVLVSHVEHMREINSLIHNKLGSSDCEPSKDSGDVLRMVKSMLASNDPDSLVEKAVECHDFIHTVAPDDAYPCDHLIDMLSSCVSAIRFGLEKPCHSRHAACAAQHIWGKVYGVRLYDNHTPAWEKQWARTQMQEAILRRLTQL